MAMPWWVLPLIGAGGSIVKNLIAGKASDQSMDHIQDGFNQANQAIREGSDRAWKELDPYLKGGREDYDRYRFLSKGGYYDTPYSGTVQPQAFQNQAVTPGQANRGTMGFDSNYQPMQFRPMGLLSSPALPNAPAMPQPQPAAQPQPQQMARNPMPMPQMGPGMSQQGIDGVTSNNLGLGMSFANKHEVPTPYELAVLPPGARNPTQPLTLQERMAIMRQGAGRGSNTFIPGYGVPGLPTYRPGLVQTPMFRGLV